MVTPADLAPQHRGDSMRSSSVLSAVTLVTLLVGPGCTTEAAEDGPLALGGGDKNILCMPSVDGHTVSAGDALTNEGETSVTIQGVSLVDAEGLEIEAAYLLPITSEGNSHTLMGNGWSMPPSFDEPGLAVFKDAWRQREEIVGAEIPPGESRELFVGLRPTTVDGSKVKAIEVSYSDGNGRSYKGATSTEVNVLVGGEACG